MDFNNTTFLESYQKALEVAQYSKATGERIRKQKDTINKAEEYNTNYGKDAILEVIPVVKQFMLDKYTQRNQHHAKFYFNYVLPTHKAYVEAVSNHVPKADLPVCPEEVIADMVAVVLISTLSNGCELVSVASKLAKECQRLFKVPTDEQEEMITDAINLFSAIIFDVSARTDIFTVDQFNGREYRLNISPQWNEVIEKEHKDSTIRITSYGPMVVKPLPHNNLFDEGGYMYSHTPLMKKPTKVNGKIHKAIENFTRESNPSYFEYIDNIQNTAYCVNVPVYEIIKGWYDDGRSFKDYPIKEDFTECDAEWVKEVAKREERRKEHMGEAYKPLTKVFVNDMKRRYRSSVTGQVLKTIDTLKEAFDYAVFDRIYFPVFVDARGRVYPYASGKLSYQGSELEKALLLFADKEAVTDEGFNALMDTLANALGHDKKRLEVKRKLAYEWFNEHVTAFLGDDWDVFIDEQGSFDEPINALAICYELVQILKDPDYKTGYIAHRDARVSGSSIIGTALHDKAIMSMTSVIDYFDEDKLGDAYTDVANKACLDCVELAKYNDAARYLLNYADRLFTRKIFKEPTMCRCSYGLTEFSIRGLVRDLFKELREEDPLIDFSHQKLFFRLMICSLDSSMKACSKYLEVFNEACFGAVKKKGFIGYKNPLNGFPVVYTKKNKDTKRIKVSIGFKKVNLTVSTVLPTINNMKVKNASAPNIIHSLDSALLCLVSGSCEHNLCLIHDSIGSHPNHVSGTIKAYAGAMYKLATTDVFNQILRQIGSTSRISKVGTATKSDIKSIINSTHILV